MLPGLAAYEMTKAVAAEGDWRVATGHFTDSLKSSSVVEYPGNCGCEIPAGLLPNLADMQSQLRRRVERAVRFGDGTTYHSFCNGMRRQGGDWAFGADLPAMPHLHLREQHLLDTVDDFAQRLKLPERTRLWYRCQMQAAFAQAQLLCEQGRKLAGKEEQLFGDLTGASQQGRVRMMFTPRSIHFRCENKEDCARLIYPNESTPSLEERRGEIRTCRGVQVMRMLPKHMSERKVSLTAENAEITQGKDAFGTFEHEQEHASNAFAIHSSTTLGTPPDGESAERLCGRLGVSYMVKEELIAWSLRHETDLEALFLGDRATYHPVKHSARQLREAKVNEQVVASFTGHAQAALQNLVPSAVSAVMRLMERCPRSAVREMLRIVPVHRWGEVAKDLLNKRA